MARTANTTIDKINVLLALDAVGKGKQRLISYPRMRKLVESGFVAATPGKKRKKSARGKAPLDYDLSDKGKKLLSVVESIEIVHPQPKARVKEEAETASI